MSRVKMRYGHSPGDADVMAMIRDELAGLRDRVMSCDTARHAPIYAAWSAASSCHAVLEGAPARHPETTAEVLAELGRPTMADMDKLASLYRRTLELTILLHPSSTAEAPIIAVAQAIRAAARDWSGNPHWSG
ncbi:MAG: hypothetical protein EON96_01555 [Caulobacteraceae bacterium]|nr:MAG: hypothetical protein EON96_01555 [Caulobacteraceae bacterium]